MSAPVLQAALLARFRSAWRDDAPANEAQNEDYFLDQLAKALAEEIIDHITTFARCNGTDSGGDSHGNVEIV